MEYVYKYLQTSGIELEADYAYAAAKSTCKYVSSKGQFKVTGYK